MRLDEIINEGITVHGPEMLAYVIVVAEVYNEKPVIDPTAIPIWNEFIASSRRLLPKVKSKVDVQYKDEDPYQSREEMKADVANNRRLQIWKGGTKHPLMTPEQNQEYRTVHDYFFHVNKNALTHGFSIRGEFNAFLSQSKMIPPRTIPVLFTELVGQFCFQFTTGTYPPQKVAVLDGFDYRQVGVVLPQRQNRYQEVLAVVKDQSQTHIPTRINGTSLEKSKIDWSVMSPSAQKAA